MESPVSFTGLILQSRLPSRYILPYPSLRSLDSSPGRVVRPDQRVGLQFEYCKDSVTQEVSVSQGV